MIVLPVCASVRLLSSIIIITCILFLFYESRQTISVSADDIIITNIEDTPNGLQVTFFVRGMSGGVITAQAVADAVRVCIL